MVDRITPFRARLCQSLISILIILFLLKVAENIFIPMAFAGLLTIILLGPCNYMEKKGLARGIAALISLLLAIVLVTAVFYFISSQLISFKKDLPAVITQLTAVLDQIQEWIRNRFHLSSDGVKGLLDCAKDLTLS